MGSIDHSTPIYVDQAQCSVTGIRFDPTDEELAVHYLAGIPHKRHLSPRLVPEVDFYSYSPRTLYSMYEIEGIDACYFITDRNKKYDGGHRPDRRAGDGYWRATGRDVVVTDGRSGPVGTVKKTLVYYKGLDKPKKTDWIMQEFRVGEPGEADLKDSKNSGSSKLDGKVLCKIYETKNEMLKETKRNHKHSKVCDKKNGTLEEIKRDLIRRRECEASKTIEMLQHENCTRVRDKEDETLEEIERDLKRRRTDLEYESSETIETCPPPPTPPAPAARLKQQLRSMPANSSHNLDATSLELHKKNEMLEEISRRTDDDLEMIDQISPPRITSHNLPGALAPAARLNHQQLPVSANSFHNPDAPSPRISEPDVINLNLSLDRSHPLFPLLIDYILQNMNNKSSSQSAITPENSPDDEGEILNMPPSEESVNSLGDPYNILKKTSNMQASVKSHDDDDDLHNAGIISPDHEPIEHPSQGFIPPPVNPELMLDLNQPYIDVER